MNGISIAAIVPVHNRATSGLPDSIADQRPSRRLIAVDDVW
jgi:hypothetical protein